jgi:hypothetical protein
VNASGTTSKRSAWVAVAGAAIALVLAGLATSHSGPSTVGALALAGYLAASIVFAATGRRSSDPRAEVTSPAAAPGRVRRRRRLILVAGVAVAVVLGVLTFERVHESLVSPGSNLVLGPVLWIASLVVLGVTVVVARPLPALPPAWTVERWPRSLRGRRLLFLALGALVVVACAARLIGLAHIPGGIKADEGDRAATAISILSGNATRNIFDTGWFYISNLYFAVLAVFLKVLGIGYAQARVFGALSSALTFVVMVWIALRHFGARAAVLTAILGAVLGVSLQFARETDEATPTALLWAVSIALFLEAAREGRAWAWVGAGIAGGLSIYFYPQGRLWGVLAVALCVYFFVRLSARRRNVVAGSVAAGLAALLTVGPFFANILVHPNLFLLRARQTSIFSGDNPTRLSYYDPSWNKVQLLWAQLEHSLAIFGSTPGATDFWPSGRPILGTALTVLTLLGLGWFSLSWRSVPRFTLAVWFWVGFVGMVVTVDTPDLERMAGAVPVIPLLAAGVLDELVHRLTRAAAYLRPQVRRVLGPAAFGCAVLVAGVLAIQQGHFYFVTYGATDRWPQPTVQGRAVADQGPGALVMTLGKDYNQINSGWVRLLAPKADRGGVESPGSILPLAIPTQQDLSFMLYPEQEAYLPFLESVYPGGSVRRYTAPTEGLVVTVYRVPQRAVQQTTGALAGPVGGAMARVTRLGAVPARLAHFPTKLRWTALLRVPQYGNYRFRLGPGPARLRIDGKTVLSAHKAHSPVSARVALARGLHFVILEALVRARARGPKLEWRSLTVPASEAAPDLTGWQAIAPYEMRPVARAQGLFGTIRGDGVPFEQRLDGAIATGGLRDEVNAGGQPFVARWSGFVRAPRSGRYTMSLFSEGAATLQLDGRAVIRRTAVAGTPTSVTLDLRRGRHSVTLVYRVGGTGGGLEWSWTPPGARASIVPPSALEPPPGTGVGPPLSTSALADQPIDVPLVVKN